jgi:hypothetical protein
MSGVNLTLKKLAIQKASSKIFSLPQKVKNQINNIASDVNKEPLLIY